MPTTKTEKRVTEPGSEERTTFEANQRIGIQNGTEPMYKGKDLSNQFTLAMNQILRRFIKEVRGGNLAPIYPEEKGGYKQRQEQMTTWSQLLGTVEKMRKTRDMVEAEESKGKIDSSGKLDNVRLFNEAQAALKAARKQ